MITGIRGLCNGLGPAMFGLIFYLFHVDLNEKVIFIIKQEDIRIYIMLHIAAAKRLDRLG